MTSQCAKIIENFSRLEFRPVAIEALWDGDSNGWGVWLGAVSSDLTSHSLGFLRGGGDWRLFSGEVPPWPEAMVAARVGQELAGRVGAEFYFPSPDRPEDQCPTWAERKSGYPCRRCGLLLLQRKDCPWRGVCYDCHLKEDREQKEAALPPEERAAPKCQFCGKPAYPELHHLHESPACARCAAELHAYTCPHCGGQGVTDKPLRSMCGRCEFESLFNSLTESQRDEIRAASATGPLAGMKCARQILMCPLDDARDIVRRLCPEEVVPLE